MGLAPEARISHRGISDSIARLITGKKRKKEKDQKGERENRQQLVRDDQDIRRIAPQQTRKPMDFGWPRERKKMKDSTQVSRAQEIGHREKMCDGRPVFELEMPELMGCWARVAR